MVINTLFARIRVAVEVERQRGQGLGQDTHTGVHGCGLHGGVFVDLLAARRRAEEEGVARAGQQVLRLVTGLEQFRENRYVRTDHLLKNEHEKNTCGRQMPDNPEMVLD